MLAGKSSLPGGNADTLMCVRANIDWPYDQFADYLTALEKRAGFENDSALARKAGIDPSLISNWRSGKRQPSQESLNKVAVALGVPRADLWIMAGLVTEEDLSEPGRRAADTPAEYQALIDLDRDERVTDEQRRFMRNSAAAAAAHVRREIPARGQPRSHRKVS